MPNASAPWADKYIAAIRNAFSYANALQHPHAQDLATNALNVFYDAYGEMGYFGHPFQNVDSKFATGDMVTDMNLREFENSVLPAFKKAVYDFTSECAKRGTDPSIFFGHAQVSDYTEFGADYLREEGSGRELKASIMPSYLKNVQSNLDENYRGFQS